MARGKKIREGLQSRRRGTGRGDRDPFLEWGISKGKGVREERTEEWG